MEYEFEIIHREGKLNVCADALSRIKVENEQSAIENNNFETVGAVQTRSKTKAQIQSDSDGGADQTRDRPRPDTVSDFRINERKGFVYDSKEFDHVSFFICGNNSRLHKQLQHKIKKKIDMSHIQYGEIVKIDNVRSAVLFPPVLCDGYNAAQAELAIKVLATLLKENLAEKIAINYDLRDVRSFAIFKKLVKKWFADANFSITIYLNSIIQITDPIEIDGVLKEFHNTVHGGHPGWVRMYENIKKYFNWSNMISDIKSFVKNCEICQKIKISRHTKQPMMISNTPTSSFANIAIDHVGRVITSDLGNSYILTAICVLTKYAIAMPVPDLTAETTARHLVEKVFLLFGYPEILTSDNHQTFQGNLFKNITKFLKINRVFTSPFTPKSNTVERFHSTLHNMLRSFVSECPTQWEQKLPFVVSAYNASVNSTTRKSPFELVFGKTMSLPDSVTKNSTPSYTYDDYAHDLRENLKYGWRTAREKLLQRKEKNKQYFDKKNQTKNLDLAVGDLVLMRNNHKTNKYDTAYVGPFEIVEITGPNSVKLRNKNRTFRAHKDQLKKYFRNDHSQSESEEEQ